MHWRKGRVCPLCGLVVAAVCLLAICAPVAGAQAGAPRDVLILARIAEGEAEVLGDEGMLAVMWVARNRVKDDRFPDDYAAVSVAFFGCKDKAKPSTTALALGFLTKCQGDDPTGGAVYVFSLTDVRRLRLPPADVMIPAEPMNRLWQLHFYRSVDWRARSEKRG